MFGDIQDVPRVQELECRDLSRAIEKVPVHARDVQVPL